MIRRPFLTPLLLALAGTLIPLGAAEPVPQEARAFEAKLTRTGGYRYLLGFPREYEADQEAKWPLILFLHGAGERGTDLEQLKKHGPPRLLAEGKDLGAIVASPQVPTGEVWDADLVKALADDLAAQHRVDLDRIYLTGLSMGGFGTWETGLKYPETFAALAPICGGVGVRFLSASRLQRMPVWIFHGAKDPVVSPADS